MPTRNSMRRSGGRPAQGVEPVRRPAGARSAAAFVRLAMIRIMLRRLTNPTLQTGRISKTYHLENWLSALGQLRAQ